MRSKSSVQPNPAIARFAFSAWARYEPIVVEWLKVYPNDYRFQMPNYSVDTVMQRMRDAVRSALHNKFPSPRGVDMTQLAQAWTGSELTWDLETESFLIRCKGQATHFKSLNSFQIAFEFDVLGPLDLQALLYLANRGAFQRDNRPVSISLPEDLLDYVSSGKYKNDFPNSVVMDHPNLKGKYIIL